MSELVAQKRARLQTIVAERAAWSKQLTQLKRMHSWVLEVEHLLDEPSGSAWGGGEQRHGGKPPGCVARTNGQAPDRRHTFRTRAGVPQRVLGRVLSNLRPYLVQCYDRQDFPRTNNEMERSIRGLKTQSRRISGRKNWNAYLLRYGRCVAYAAWWEQDVAHRQQLEQHTAFSP